MKILHQKLFMSIVPFGLLLSFWSFTEFYSSWIGLPMNIAFIKGLKPAVFKTKSRQFLQEMGDQNNSAAEGVLRKSETRPWHDTTVLENNASNQTGEFSAASEACGKPKHNIVFFKMHKCSSSTVQNVLMRYGDKHNLNFVLPPSGNQLGRRPIQKDLLRFPDEGYNILCHHTIFSFEGISEVMPKDSVWITIIRDPVYMFESTFYYMSLSGKLHIHESDPLATFAENPLSYMKYGKRFGGIKDPMLFDLGFSEDKKDDIKFIKEMIAKLDGYFDLVLVTEYFEESLILFKELMCWELDDIAYFVVNARANNSIHKMTDETVENLRKWNMGDQMLYKYFNLTLWKKIEAFGVERMKKEVLLLKARNEELKEKCIIDPSKTVNKGAIWHPKGINIKGLVLKPGMEKDELCKDMAMPELKFTAYLLEKQKERYGIN